MEGRTQAMPARRQLEHGESLSQRTFRDRQTTQLRGFDAGPAAGPGDSEVVFMILSHVG